MWQGLRTLGLVAPQVLSSWAGKVSAQPGLCQVHLQTSQPGPEYSFPTVPQMNQKPLLGTVEQMSPPKLPPSERGNEARGGTEDPLD